MIQKEVKPKFFIAALTEHKVLGYMFTAYLVEDSGKGFYPVVQQATWRYIDSLDFEFLPEQRKLIQTIDNYSEENLAKKFSPKNDVQDLFKPENNERFAKYVYPYFDKQLSRCIDIIVKNKIALYVKTANFSTLYDEDRVEIEPIETEPIFHFELKDTELQYWLTLKHNDQTLKIYKRKLHIITELPCRFVLHNRLYWFNNLSSKRLLPFTERDIIRIPISMAEKYFKTFVSSIIRENKVVAKGFDIVDSDSEKQAVLAIEEGMRMAPMLTLYYRYGRRQFLAGNKGLSEVELNNENGRYVFLRYSRDNHWEKSIVSFLEEQGLTLNVNQLELLEADADVQYGGLAWVNAHRKLLDDQRIIVENHMTDRRYYLGSQHLEIKVNNENDWFDLYAVVHFGDYQIPFIKLRKNIINGIREYQLPSGEIAILPNDWFAKFADLIPLAESSNSVLRFANYHYKILNDRLKNNFIGVRNPFAKLENIKFEQVDPPHDLRAVLRSYQQMGYSWMYTLSQNHFGGCLADDMGLGKTVQTLALLLKKKEETPVVEGGEQTNGQLDIFSIPMSQKTGSLIVVPTSLVHNWDNEIKKFAPQLRVYKHVGSQRCKGGELQRALNAYDVIITSYCIVRNDYQQLSQANFEYLILDESQSIKNSESKAYQAVMELHAGNRIAITGTPIENSLSDLWSQMNFLNRGLLGNQSFFKTNFLTPIERFNDEEKQRRLQMLINPFILRRSKEEVASDLPPIMEQVSYCAMSEEQHSLYEQKKSAIRNSLLDNLRVNGLKQSQILILKGLTELRQLANHPAMIEGNVGIESGKFDEVMINLENLIAEHHKVLMFSSYVKHLSLFETEFQSRKWDYCLLTGQTTNRQQVIDSFQNDPSKQIFLISLKAGGVGLNLTSADYIFILDPWWNPAAENQAISRAHRIGQDKKVFVYRFITADTIEEKIQNLKERKSLLASLFVRSNNPFEKITSEDIIDLFS